DRPKPADAHATAVAVSIDPPARAGATAAIAQIAAGAVEAAEAAVEGARGKGGAASLNRRSWSSMRDRLSVGRTDPGTMKRAGRSAPTFWRFFVAATSPGDFMPPPLRTGPGWRFTPCRESPYRYDKGCIVVTTQRCGPLESIAS